MQNIWTGSWKSCSNKEYWNLAGFVRARKKRELWLEKNKYLQAVIRGELYFVNFFFAKDC